MVKELFEYDKIEKRGRPKYSVRTPQGMIERFLKRNISPTQLQKLFSRLTAREQADFLISVMPYIIAKKSPESLSATEIDKLYQRIEQLSNSPVHAAKAQ